MTDDQQSLVTFGGGVKPTRDDREVAHATRSDRARHRRTLYADGRCRAISKSKGTRCGAGVHADADDLCHYHRLETQPVTIDDAPGLLARWCGTRPTTWEQIPEPCRNALEIVDPDAADR